MAYCTAGEIKTYLGITGSGDDALISTLAQIAQSVIDVYTGRTFEANADATRYFEVGVDTVGDTLYLDDDLAAITSVITNADGTSPTTLATTDYITLPRNRAPYFAIKILGSSDYVWDYSDDPENGVTVTGKWAYSTTAPDDIQHACTRLAAYFYRQKDAQVFDVTAIPDAGVITVPQGIPADVKIMLGPYRKTVHI
jgi:hypothetical protein